MLYVISYPGLTPPLSTTPPTTEELQYTKSLEECLKKDFDVFETEAEINHRYAILSLLLPTNVCISGYKYRHGFL